MRDFAWKAWAWKLGLPACFVALGINGFIDVGLQRDMAAKTAKLDVQVALAKQRASQLHNGLLGLAQLKQTTFNMQNNLVLVEQSTAAMADGLQMLSTTVAGINGSVTQIGRSTVTSSSQLLQTEKAAQNALSNLQTLNAVNHEVVDNVASMLTSEESINRNLQQMNQKTALVP